MAKSKPSPEHSLFLETNPTDPKMTALQTLAAGFALGTTFELMADDKVRVDAEIDAAQDSAWPVFLDQVAANIEEIRAAFIYAEQWRYEHRELELATMPYADYLGTMEWHQTRTQVVALAGGRCQVCNSPDNLHVHHRTYERRGHEELSDLTALCADCHGLFHKNGRVK